jgi:uncharacterized protein YjiS (DUF1127 family)
MFAKIAVAQNGFSPASTTAQWSSIAAAMLRSLWLYRSRRRTARVLQGLDDAGLKDIGLQRGMVDAAFQDARYSPRL